MQVFKLTYVSKKNGEVGGGEMRYPKSGNYRHKENEPGIRTTDEKRQMETIWKKSTQR